MGENWERSKMYQGNTSEKVYLWMWIVAESTSRVLLARRKRIKEELSSSKLSYFILANFPLQNYLVAASFLHTWHTGMSYIYGKVTINCKSWAFSALVATSKLRELYYGQFSTPFALQNFPSYKLSKSKPSELLELSSNRNLTLPNAKKHCFLL